MPAQETVVAHDVPAHESSTSSDTNVNPPPPRKSTRECDDYDGIESLKRDLDHRFAMKDLGLLRSEPDLISG
ncbi:hypothetical protein L1987_51310 [Smallanthus sonchifolius]|uniref:Uncharacterized protein n=1 Tax=Smallanthus sonchifolius TaxID=185202 RepID=A0ACB9EQQ5_9ASTR|nr:hypothetical protein L1987_51310 [Smallanthus sonchifolius]